MPSLLMDAKSAPTWRNLRERDAQKLSKFLKRSTTSLPRHDGALLRSQSNLDYVTWLKLGIFLCDKAFPAFLGPPDDGDLRLAADSTYELRPHQRRVLKFLTDALQLCPDLIEPHTSVLKFLQ